MKILEIKDGKGFFHCYKDTEWKPIDQIDKDGLMGLLDNYLEGDVEMDDYDENIVHNQAHQIIYESIFNKFSALNNKKTQFTDESDRLYLEEIKKYKIIASAPSENASSEPANSSAEEKELPRVRSF